MDQERFLGSLIRAVFGILILQCVYLQIVRYGYYSRKATSQSIRTIETGIPRGDILDRNGRMLARDIPCFNLVYVPFDLKEPRREAETLAGIIGMDRARIESVFTRKRINPFDRVMIKRQLSEAEVALVSEKALSLPGIFVQAGIDRIYPLGESLCHAVGYIGEISPAQLEKFKEKGLKAGDMIGQFGIERQYDDALRGVSGGILVEVDALGHHRKILGEKKMKRGSALVTTIDQTIQEAASAALGGERGCVVAMDPRNGEILALVSKPGFDPSDVASGLRSGGGNPFLNRVIQGAYPPGSVFKIVTEIAALESHQIGEYDRVECTGSITVGDTVFHCWKDDGHGWVDINLALPNSCNVFFGTIGMRIGVQQILEYGKIFGLGRQLGIDLPGEVSGNLPTPAAAGGPLNLAIGQGALATTPLQMLSIVSTVANEGNIWRPHVVRKIVTPEGQTVREFQPALAGAAYVSKETMEILRKGLKNVVKFGTAGGARVEAFEVAGKTGTAQRGGDLATHGAFVCYAPADKPTIAMAVFLDTGASGQAARMAGDILRRVFTPEPADGGAGETEVDHADETGDGAV